MLLRRLRCAVARLERHTACTVRCRTVCPGGEQDVAQRGHHRDDALAGERLRLRTGLIRIARWDQDAAARQVDAIGGQSAQLADPRPGEDEGRDHRAALRTVPGGLVEPQQAAADLTDQDIGDAELAGQLDGAAVRGADVGDLVPVERSVAGIELTGKRAAVAAHHADLGLRSAAPGVFV
jgi:hypothetical protein